MSEEPKNIRLNKAAKELNVGIPTMVEYLAKKGHTIDANPNARLTPEQYALLATAFKADSQVKENADRIEINTGNTVVIEATGANETGESNDFSDEVIIKNFNTPKTKETTKEQPFADSDAPEEKPQDSTPEPESEKFIWNR